MIIKTTQDPELQKKQAEQAEKERMKAQRRRETAAAKMDGIGRYKSGGLSIGDLEGGRRAPGAGRKRGAPGAARTKRRRPEYDSDDELPQGARRQDEYDMEDDFIVASDEELESGEGDDDAHAAISQFVCRFNQTFIQKLRFVDADDFRIFFDV